MNRIYPDGVSIKVGKISWLKPRTVNSVVSIQMKKQKSPLDRFSAKLLFQYRVVVGGRDNVMRTCEERMVVLRSSAARGALTLAKRRGKAAQFRQRNSDGNPVYFEFVG